MKNRQSSKRCPSCGEEFSIRDLISSREIMPLGMSSQENKPELNVFYFQHDVPQCGSTFIVPVEEFVELIEEPVPLNNFYRTHACENHCDSALALAHCDQRCVYAPYRRLLLSLLDASETEPA